MNEHLEPVFNILLPELKKAEIDYWVYGGVSIAACVGEFIRPNKDVDVFVRDMDFEKAKSVLDKICVKNNFNLIYIQPKKEGEKPKINIKIDNNERLSIIPAYLNNDTIEFKYPKNMGGNEQYPTQILERIERNISGYKFFTPQDRFIKEIFIKHTNARQDKKTRKYFKIDARAILNSQELAGYGWNID